MCQGGKSALGGFLSGFGTMFYMARGGMQDNQRYTNDKWNNGGDISWRNRRVACCLASCRSSVGVRTSAALLARRVGLVGYLALTWR
jgi:hypothetical protein